MKALQTTIVLALLADASAAAAGADSTCDASLAATLAAAATDCAAANGACPPSCLAALEALENDCAAKKFTYDDTRDGEDVEVALEWNTDKAHWLSVYEAAKNQGQAGNPDQCMEVIHDYQLEHINDCNEAHSNAAYDIVNGYYCKEPQSTSATCHKVCQETIDKLDSVCNPVQGPVGQFYLEDDDAYTANTYEWATMIGMRILGPDSCSYDFTRHPSPPPPPSPPTLPSPPPSAPSSSSDLGPLLLYASFAPALMLFLV